MSLLVVFASFACIALNLLFSFCICLICFDGSPFGSKVSISATPWAPPAGSISPSVAAKPLDFCNNSENLFCVDEFSTSISVERLSQLPSLFLAEIILNNPPWFSICGRSFSLKSIAE